MTLASTAHVLAEVLGERERQVERYGDDESYKPLEDWAWLLGRRANDLATPGGPPADSPRRLLLEIAAIAVAGVEALDRAAAAAKVP